MRSASTAAVGGKAARACDSCLRRRARWFCAADDAFLCQACDASVHSANPLARRHERVRLRPTSLEQEAVVAASASSKRNNKRRRRQVTPAAWSKRKARTRRPQVKSVGQLLSRKLVVVPEVASSDSTSSEERKVINEDGAEEEEEQLLYHRVPSFDRALAEICSPQPPPVDDAAARAASSRRENVENSNQDPVAATSSPPVQQLPDSFAAGFGPTDAELREFAADMEALLRQGLDNSNELDESFYMESLGLMTPADQDDGERVKTNKDRPNNAGAIPQSEGPTAELKSEASAEVLDIDFNCCSSTAVDRHEEEDESFEPKAAAASNAADAQFLRRSLDLRLNYESVIESWGSSPWTDGQRPHVRLDDFWPHAYHHSGAGTTAAGGGGQPGGGPLTPRWGTDGGREARVSRYREKRRTRLFAKKIRYEVRKLNAEKRPRMKGRFVKRPAAGGGATAAVAAAAQCAVT